MRRILLLALAVLATCSNRAEACECSSGGPPCQNYFEATAVFAGTVQSIEDTTAPEHPGYLRKRVRFALDRAFRGVEGTSVEVTTGQGGGDCGYAFVVGKSYLVYAYRTTSTHELAASICSRTRPLDAADEDLRYIETLPPTGTGGRVYGVITHWERDLANGQPLDRGPLRAVRVGIQGEAGTFEARTDGAGRYEVTGLPPGTYTIQVVPPAPFGTRYLTARIEVRDPRACAVRDFGVVFDGRISGTAVDAGGRAVAGAVIEVMAAGHDGESSPAELLTVTTDTNGRYEFIEVPPGRYVVGLSLRRGMEAANVYPRTFYPDALAASDAMVVEIGEGTRRELPPFHLPPARAPVTLTGVVTWPDGRPASGAWVSLWDADTTWRQVAVGIRAESDGQFRFTTHAGLAYVAMASAEIPGDARRRQGSIRTAPFVARADMPALRLVLAIPPER